MLMRTRIVRLLLTVVSATCALLGVLLLGCTTLVPHTVQNGNEINAAFLEAAEFTDRFRSSFSRLPNSEELAAWGKGNPNRWVGYIQLIPADQINEEVASVLGSAPRDGYALWLWRGEWSEHYASWSKKTTVDSAAGLYASSLGLGLALLGVSLLAWRLRKLPSQNAIGDKAGGA